MIDDTVKKALCDSMLASLKKQMKQFTDVTNKMQNTVNDLGSKLSEITPDDNINDSINTITNNVPDFSANIDDFNDLINGCTAFSMMGIKNPADALNDFLNNKKPSFGNPLTDMAFNLFDLSKKINELNPSNLIADIDKFINCLDGVCGYDVTEQIDEINNTMDKSSLDINGNFDMNNMMLKANNNDVIDQLKLIQNKISEIG